MSIIRFNLDGEEIHCKECKITTSDKDGYRMYETSEGEWHIYNRNKSGTIETYETHNGKKYTKKFDAFGKLAYYKTIGYTGLCFEYATYDKLGYLVWFNSDGNRI